VMFDVLWKFKSAVESRRYATDDKAG
jgi:hypothetical protein